MSLLYKILDNIVVGFGIGLGFYLAQYVLARL